MFSLLRNRFGIPGIISVIALVFAMAGGAFAAGNLKSNGSDATASAKGKQGPRGKTGKTGPAGPQGPAGPKGDTGATGATGSAGTAGVVGATGATGAAGKNGEDGETGFTETLPSGKTEMGSWSTTGVEDFVGISFSIPLANPLDEDHVLTLPVGYNGEDEVGAEHEQCPGTAAGPQAKEGYLCVYVANKFGPTEATVAVFDSSKAFGIPGAATSGALVFTEGVEGVWGTWALTGE